MNIFGQRLRELRQNEGWTMKELGDLISNAVNSTFSSASVANWEKRGLNLLITFLQQLHKFLMLVLIF
ncbi:helix-turn-helix domain-containing protein [Bacillus cereus]